jgi:hypothetical protein
MRRVHARLERGGLLLAHDGALASVSALVAGEPVPGSWWSHPLAHPIYDAMQALDHDHGGDALRVKLLRRKVTFVHRRLWPALFAVASARDAWQTSGLSPQARRLLAQVEDAGLVRMDALPRIKPVATAARDLERRLLVLGDEIHTETGAHAKVLESWAHAHERLRLPRSRPSSADGRRDLEAAAAALGPDGVGALPWSPRSGPSSRARGRGS